MLSKLEFYKRNTFLTALLYIIAGILLFIFKADILNWFMMIIGSYLVVIGIVNMVKWSMPEGAVDIILGIVVIFGGWLFIDIALLIIGAMLAIDGIFKFMNSRVFKDRLSMISSIITIIVGLMLIVSKWALLDWIFVLAGIILIIDGIMILFDRKA